MHFVFIYAVQVLTTQTALLLAWLLFGNPGVYSGNKHKNRQSSLNGKFALAVAGTVRRSPKHGPCRWAVLLLPGGLICFNLLLQPWQRLCSQQLRTAVPARSTAPAASDAPAPTQRPPCPSHTSPASCRKSQHSIRTLTSFSQPSSK